MLEELAVPYEFCVVTGLMETGPEHFAQNPLHMFPVLEHGKESLIESDLICEYLIDKFGTGKALAALLPRPEQKYADQKRLAIMNGAMDAGVKLMRARRSEIPNFDQYVFFRQERAAIQAALDWLEQDLHGRTDYVPGCFTMLEISLLCLLEWAIFRGMISDLEEWPTLAAFVEKHRTRPSAVKTHPAKEA